MATLKAPYNFAPLSDRVFFPEWADQISMDIPFSDGISGSIDLNIKALTPIFVRNGHSKQDGENKNDTYKSFSKAPDGKYFIPATSIKGEIRDVLEILSCGKLGTDRFKNQSFGIRDLLKGVDGDFYKSKIATDNIRCGWMFKDGDSYFIEDKGIPWRISPEEIDAHLGTCLDEFVKGNNFTSDENKTAKKKYEIINSNDIYGSIKGNFCEDIDLRDKLEVGNRPFVKFGGSDNPGTIVLTGQSSQRKIGNRTNKKGEKVWGGKYFEFVFPEEPEDGDRTLPVDDSVIKSFISIYARCSRLPGIQEGSTRKRRQDTSLLYEGSRRERGIHRPFIYVQISST
jgi:CRISPR/Cas system CSM-associated protein Csm3 (group 7 of RAMP superfamily)